MLDSEEVAMNKYTNNGVFFLECMHSRFAGFKSISKRLSKKTFKKEKNKKLQVFCSSKTPASSISANHSSSSLADHLVLQQGKQKILIDILLQYSQWNRVDLAGMLNLTSIELKNVLQGESYLNNRQVANLLDYFCLLMNG